MKHKDNINTIGINKRDVTAAFIAIENEFAKMGLVVNEGKIKYLS